MRNLLKMHNFKMFFQVANRNSHLHFNRKFLCRM